jgi:2,3-diketo-5-methylthio-1-phosphopentane phosphatase
MPATFLIDFDGTASPSDIGAAFVRRFASGDGAALRSALRRWRDDEIGHRELTEVECAALAVTEEEALAFTRGFALDPAFAPFVADVLGRGHEALVVSEGFDFYIADHLRRAGLGHVRYAANRARFAGGRVVPEFPHDPGGCRRCGNCKGERAREQRARGREVVLIGDGLSDRCGARAADHVLARGDLLAWCRAGGIAAVPFQDFRDVAAWAAARDAAGRAAGGGGA